MPHKEIEKRSLVVSSVVNLIMAWAGFWIFKTTGIQALFLDGFFSLIGFVSTVFAVVIGKVSKRRTKAYPDGLYFLEPLYAILKSLLTLALLTVSVAATAGTAYEFFARGEGSPMHIGPVLPYTLSMVLLCFGLGVFNSLQNKKINNTSTILVAEAKCNYVDGILSLGVGVAVLLLYFIDIGGTWGFLHYTGDFFITTLLSLISIKAPITVLGTAFKELSSAVTTDKEIKKVVLGTVDAHLKHPPGGIRCDIFKMGMHIKVRISLAEDCGADAFRSLVSARQKIVEDLKGKYESVELMFAF